MCSTRILYKPTSLLLPPVCQYLLKDHGKQDAFSCSYRGGSELPLWVDDYGR